MPRRERADSEANGQVRTRNMEESTAREVEIVDTTEGSESSDETNHEKYKSMAKERNLPQEANFLNDDTLLIFSKRCEIRMSDPSTTRMTRSQTQQKQKTQSIYPKWWRTRADVRAVTRRDVTGRTSWG